MKTTKKRKTPKFGGHSKAQVLDAIQGCHGFVNQIATTLKKAVQVARQKNLQCIQDATVGGAVLSETEYYDKSGNVTSKKTVYPAPSWQAAAWQRSKIDRVCVNNVNPKKRKAQKFGGHSKAQVLVRYFERVLGFDIESIKQEILLEDFLTVLSGKFFSSPAPGYPFAKGLGL